MSYLKHKPGSIEEIMASRAKELNDNAYQDMFKKELEKAGKGIGAMTPAEKKAFFNKIDDKYKAKNEDINESTDINFMKGDGAEVSYLKRHGSFMGDGKYYKFRGVNINFFVYYNEKNKNYVHQLKLTSGNRPSNDREYDKMYDVLGKLGRENRLGKLDDSDVDIYFEGVNEAKVDNPYAVGMAAAMKKTGDKPPLKKSTITKAHDIAKSIEKDEKKEEKDVPKGYHRMPDGSIMKDSEHKKETHSYATNKMNQSQKDAKGEKDLVKLAAEELNKDDEKAVKKVKDMLSKASQAHAGQAKELDKAMKNEADEKGDEINKKKLDMVKKGEKEIVDPAPKMKFKEAYKKAKKEAMNTVGDATADQANQLAGEGPKENDPDIKKPKAKADTGSKATPVDTSPEVEYKN